MEVSDFANLYFNRNVDKLQQIKNFESNRGIKLLKKLEEDRNEINFLSWLSEVNFGMRFDKIASAIAYEKPMDNQTPDWLVTANNQLIMAEVLRVNIHAELLADKIEEFKNQPPPDKNLIGVITYSNTLDLAYFYGARDKIVKKEIAYRRLIEKKRLPFIICVDCSEPQLFTYLNDFTDFFLANGTHGYFFQDDKFGQNVTGLFIRVPFDGYKFIANPVAMNKLNAENHEDVLKICD